ncbi:serine/threonine-protein kinase ATM isoform X2 [Cajanus cajan]|uniref:serine/threonine-protein kinase ATM isoform X2 n=1 Tax=Cajanus cajan TaxID=3821 RepID=UPI00098D8C7E|nr:serine/threonine-protein kinase ATM isoform X2 [Cajanus cajan]
MDVVMTPAKEEPNSDDETKGTENTIMTEEALEKYGGCFDSRDRRKSKYLSSPYTNIGPKQKDLPAETEDLRTPCPSQKAEASSIATMPLHGSSSNAKLGSKRFRKNWYKKFISCNTMSSNQEFMNASADELLSGLYSTAIDCMFPVGSKSFDLVERFFCRYRVSNYHDEAELATSLVNAKEEKIGEPVGDLPDSKTKKRKNNKMENTVRRKRKSLSGLSDVNANTSSCDSLKPERILKQKRKVKEITSVNQPQNVEINMNGSSSNYSSVPEASQNLSCLASEGKAVHKKRGKIEAQKHQNTQINSVHRDAKSHNCSSLVIDLQFTSPAIPVDIPEKNKYENKEELVFLASNPESRVSQEGQVGSIIDHRLLLSTKAGVGTVLGNKTGLKNSMGKAAEVPLNTKLAIEKTGLKNSMVKAAELALNTNLAIGKTGLKNSMVKAADLPLNTILAIGATGLKNSMEKTVEKPLNTKLAIEIPDLNGTGSEYNSISPEFDGVNFFSPEPKSEQSRSFLECSTPTTKTTSYNRLEDNGESLGNCLLLRFAREAYIPSKEDLMTTFCRFGPLKGSETQLLKDTGSAQVVFVRSADAAAAFHSLQQNKFVFGSTVVDCKLQHLSAASPPAEQLVTPAQPTGYTTMPGVTPIQPNGYRTMPGVNHTQPNGSMVAMPGVIPTQPTGSVAMPGETPPLQFIKQNLQMMTSVLENSGSSLSPQMRAKLDTEIKTLMRKVDSRTKA